MFEFTGVRYCLVVSTNTWQRSVPYLNRIKKMTYNESLLLVHDLKGMKGTQKITLALCFTHLCVPMWHVEPKFACAHRVGKAWEMLKMRNFAFGSVIRYPLGVNNWFVKHSSEHDPLNISLRWLAVVNEIDVLVTHENSGRSNLRALCSQLQPLLRYCIPTCMPHHAGRRFLY